MGWVGKKITIKTYTINSSYLSNRGCQHTVVIAVPIEIDYNLDVNNFQTFHAKKSQQKSFKRNPQKHRSDKQVPT